MVRILMDKGKRLDLSEFRRGRTDYREATKEKIVTSELYTIKVDEQT